MHFVPGPLYHNAPFSFSIGGLLGNHVVILPFDAEATLRSIEEHRRLDPGAHDDAAHLAAADEVRHRYDLSSLQVVWHLAAPCPRG